MRLQVFDVREARDSREFVAFWSALYSYPHEPLYRDNIGRPLTEDRVWDLYKWKNGGNISEGKQGSIRRVYLPELAAIPTLTTIDAGRDYLGQLDGGPIWDIFWLHCIAPNVYPIFDQHAFRAMTAIRDGTARELTGSRARKIDVYFDEYLPFFNGFSASERRPLDQALFTYGRFLASGFSAGVSR